MLKICYLSEHSMSFIFSGNSTLCHFLGFPWMCVVGVGGERKGEACTASSLRPLLSESGYFMPRTNMTSPVLKSYPRSAFEETMGLLVLHTTFTLFPAFSLNFWTDNQSVCIIWTVSFNMYKSWRKSNPVESETRDAKVNSTTTATWFPLCPPLHLPQVSG